MDKLGIYEEAARRREHHASRNFQLKRRITGCGPARWSGPTAQAVNPFGPPCHLPIEARPPFWQLHAESRIRRRLRLGILRDDLDVNPMQIVQAVCQVAGLTTGRLFSLDRTRSVSWPRQVAVYFIARYCRELSLPQIAYVFGHDHTTTMYSIRIVPARIEAGEQTTRELVDKVEALLRGLK